MRKRIPQFLFNALSCVHVFSDVRTQPKLIRHVMARSASDAAILSFTSDGRVGRLRPPPRHDMAKVFRFSPADDSIFIQEKIAMK
jgi:hypothetical protein